MAGTTNGDSRDSCAASKVQRILKRPQTAQNCAAPSFDARTTILCEM